MDLKVIEGTHVVFGNIMAGGHSYSENVMSGLHRYSDNIKTGLHMQMWFGDRFINGIQDEDGYFIFDKTGQIIFEE